jgi:hypothetical protein
VFTPDGVHPMPLCELHELSDGTYTLEDLLDMHEVMDTIEEDLRRRREATRPED